MVRNINCYHYQFLDMVFISEFRDILTQIVCFPLWEAESMAGTGSFWLEPHPIYHDH
jgi:hypothetical protein